MRLDTTMTFEIAMYILDSPRMFSLHFYIARMYPTIQ